MSCAGPLCRPLEKTCASSNVGFNADNLYVLFLAFLTFCSTVIYHSPSSPPTPIPSMHSLISLFTWLLLLQPKWPSLLLLPEQAPAFHLHRLHTSCPLCGTFSPTCHPTNRHNPAFSFQPSLIVFLKVAHLSSLSY